MTAKNEKQTRLPTHESNPARYRAMSEPFADADAANGAIQSFMDDVKLSRVRHKITDVHMIIKIGWMMVDDGEEREGEGLLTVHLGDPGNAEAMTAYGYGRAVKDRQDAIAAKVALAGKTLKRMKDEP